MTCICRFQFIWFSNTKGTSCPASVLVGQALHGVTLMVVNITLTPVCAIVPPHTHTLSRPMSNPKLRRALRIQKHARSARRSRRSTRRKNGPVPRVRTARTRLLLTGTRKYHVRILHYQPCACAEVACSCPQHATRKEFNPRVGFCHCCMVWARIGMASRLNLTNARTFLLIRIPLPITRANANRGRPRMACTYRPYAGKVCCGQVFGDSFRQDNHDCTRCVQRVRCKHVPK